MRALEPNSSEWRRHWPLLAALGVVLLYDAPLLLMHGLGLSMDGLRQYYPAEYVLAHALRSGTLPFWTPNVQAGFPLFAEGQPGGLYPINLLALGLLPTPLAHNAIIAVHHLLGVAFTFCWGRTLQIERAAAAWMALVFALTTWLAGSDILLIETMTWVPLLFLMAERLVRRGAPRTAWVAVPPLAMQWLGGFPQIALYTALATHIYLVVRVCAEPWPWSQRLRTVAAWSAAVLIAVLLAAPQLLPQYELSQFSIRAAGIQGSLSGEKSLLPPALITLVLPSWLGFFRSAGLGVGIYVGLLPCLVGLAAVINGPRPRWCYPLLAVGLATTLLAFGHFSPLFPLMRQVPGFAFFRYPSRFLVFTQFCLVTFFGLGWQRLSTDAGAPFDRTLRRLLFAVAALALLNVAVAHPLLERFRPELTAYAERYTRTHIMTDPYHLQPLSYFQAKISALYGALIAATSWRHVDAVLPGCVAAVALLVVRWPGVQQWRRALLGGLVFVDVLVFAGGFHHTEPAALVTTDPPTQRVLAQLIGRPPCRLFWLAEAPAEVLRQERILLTANYNLISGLPVTGVYAPLGFHAYYRLMDRLGTVDLGFGARPVTPEDVAHDRALLDFLNVGYVLSRQPLNGFSEVAQIEGTWIYRNDRVAPRAFAVDQIEQVPSVAAALTWVKEHPEHLRDTAVLDQPLEVSFARGDAERSKVSVLAYEPQAVSVAVTAPGSVVLVMSDTYYPGWQARLDGQVTPIYRTHGVFRAVVVPAGTHRVEFQYEPRTFWHGVTIAGIAAALCVAWAVGARRSGAARRLLSKGGFGDNR